MNSREKGKRGERQWRDELRANGYAARRGQQFSGSPDSPDVICDGLPWAHFEVKVVERLDIYAAMDQARRDCGGRVPLVAHRRNYWPWLVSMDAERFYRLLGVDITGQWAERMAGGAPGAVFAGLPWAFGTVCEGKRLNIHEVMRDAGRIAKSEIRNPKAEVGSHLTPTLSPCGEGGRRQRVPIIAHRRPGGRWVITMTGDSFFRLLRGDLTEGNRGNGDGTDGKNGTDGLSTIANRQAGRSQISGFQKRCAQESRP